MISDRTLSLGLVFLFGVAVGVSLSEAGTQRPSPSPSQAAPVPRANTTLYCPREQYGRALQAVVRHQPDQGFWYYYSCYYGKQTRKDVL